MKETKFKQTEVGMIPNDWEVLPIKGLCTKVTDGSHESPKEVDNGYYMPSVKDMTDLGFCFSDCKQISENDYLKLERNGCRPEKDDVLIAKDGSILKYAFVMDDELPIVILSSIAILRPNKKKIDSHYFAHYFKKEDFVNKVLSDYKTGTGVPRIVLNNFKEIEIAYPKKIEEQQRVANALSDVDTLIANLEKLIAKKKNIKQGAMQQLLTGRKRLPGFAPDERTGSRPTDERRKECHSERSAKREVEESSGYKMTELGLIPNDWEVKTFGDVGKGFSAGATPYRQVDRYYEGDIKWVSSGELDYNVIQETQEHISIEAVKATNLTLHPKNTFLMAITGLEAAGTRGRCAILGCEATTNQSCLAIYESEYLSIPYLYHFYVKYGDALAFAYAQGSKQQSFTAAIVKKLPIILPSSKAEQTAIANVLSDMDSEISALETKLAKYRTLKTGMMQQLLTGKTRLV